MLKHLSVIIFALTIGTSYSQLDSLKYHGDVEFSKGNYAKAIENYAKSNRGNLSTKQLGRLLYSEYQSNQFDEIDSSFTKWIEHGYMPGYIVSVLKYKYKKLIPFIEDTLFTAKKACEWNQIYGTVIAQSPTEFFTSNKFMLNDQHLRFVEIHTSKRVDQETFLRSDSLNMIAIIDYLSNNTPKFKKTTSDILFGVIHHYCAENFFSVQHYNFFESKMTELVNTGVLDIFDYCYFVDKYSVFHGEIQKYGTYSEMDGLSGISIENYSEINSERRKIGFHLKIEDQLKYRI